jgi:hypothetical protein
LDDDKPDPARLHKRWLHSYEEDTETEAVYRPESYPFPPSRGPRPGFELRPDGSCTLFGIAPTDAPTTESGDWNLSGDAQVLTCTDQTRKPAMSMKLASVTEDRLALKKE